MKFPRRNRTTKPPIVLELAGLNALPDIPRNLTIQHVIQRKPTAPPTRVRLQLPPSAQVGMKDPESGQYIPLDSIELEFEWERKY